MTKIPTPELIRRGFPLSVAMAMKITKTKCLPRIVWFDDEAKDLGIDHIPVPAWSLLPLLSLYIACFREAHPGIKHELICGPAKNDAGEDIIGFSYHGTDGHWFYEMPENADPEEIGLNPVWEKHPCECEHKEDSPHAPSMN